MDGLLQFSILKERLILLGKLLEHYQQGLAVSYSGALLQDLMVKLFPPLWNTGQEIQVAWWQYFMCATFGVLKSHNYTNIIY